MKKYLNLFILLTLNGALCQVMADSFEKEGFYMENYLRARYNPWGSGLKTMVYYHIPLQKEGKLFEKNHIDIGAENTVSFANETPGAFINWEPVSFFDISVKTFVDFAYNLFGYGIPRLPFDNSSIRASDLDGYQRGKSDSGFIVLFIPRLKFKFGPLVLMDQFSFSYYDYYTINSRMIYNINIDTRMKSKDYVCINSSYAVFQVNENFILGLNNDYLFVQNSGYDFDRLSLLAGYSALLREKVKLSANILAGYFLKHEIFDIYLAGEISLSHRI